MMLGAAWVGERSRISSQVQEAKVQPCPTGTARSVGAVFGGIHLNALCQPTGGHEDGARQPYK